MPALHEQLAIQATTYFDLLDIRAQNPGIKIKGLNQKIQRAKASMQEPEIAWVEKQIMEMYKEED